MLKKIIGYSLLVFMFISLVLSLAGFTSVDLMSKSNTFFRMVAYRFNQWGAFEFPKLKKLPLFNAQGWFVILNALIYLINMIITISNLAITITNFVIQAFEFVGAVISLLFDVPEVFKSALMLI